MIGRSQRAHPPRSATRRRREPERRPGAGATLPFCRWTSSKAGDGRKATAHAPAAAADCACAPRGGFPVAWLRPAAAQGSGSAREVCFGPRPALGKQTPGSRPGGRPRPGLRRPAPSPARPLPRRTPRRVRRCPGSPSRGDESQGCVRPSAAVERVRDRRGQARGVPPRSASCSFPGRVFGTGVLPCIPSFPPEKGRFRRWGSFQPAGPAHSPAPLPGKARPAPTCPSSFRGWGGVRLHSPARPSSQQRGRAPSSDQCGQRAPGSGRRGLLGWAGSLLTCGTRAWGEGRSVAQLPVCSDSGREQPRCQGVREEVQPI